MSIRYAWPSTLLFLSLAAGCGGRVVSTDAGASDAVSSDAALVSDSALVSDGAPESATIDAPIIAPDAPALDAPVLDGPLGDAATNDVVTSDVLRLDVVPSDAPARDVAAGDASLCEAGATACTTGAALYCADLNNDNNNCGSCGYRCCAGQRCAAGRCEGGFGCVPGSVICRGADGCICINTTSDSANCGACGNACTGGAICVMGACVIACAPYTGPASPVGVCDGRGMIACQRWAQESAGGNPNATAVCVSSPSGCARADRCERPDDPTSCRCGASAACGPNEVCVLSGPTARCVCAGAAM